MKQTAFQRYLSLKVLPIWTVLLADTIFVILSCFLAYALRYGLDHLFLETSTLDTTILWCVIVNLIFFRVFHTYSNVLRFSSFVDIMRIFVSISISYSSLLVVDAVTQVCWQMRWASLGVLMIAYIINFAVMACSRMVIKVFFDILNTEGSFGKSVFIYGAKEAGVNLAKALRVSLRNHYRLRGFIADEPELVNKVMMGVKVFANDDALLDNLEAVQCAPLLCRLQDGRFEEERCSRPHTCARHQATDCSSLERMGFTARAGIYQAERDTN